MRRTLHPAITQPSLAQQAEKGWDMKSTLRSSHLDSHGRLSMVDVTEKPETPRYAAASGLLRAEPFVIAALCDGSLEKGEALVAARLAGIQAAKRTGELIPLCHPVPLTQVTVHFVPCEQGIVIKAEASCIGRTGVEMEALTAVTVAGLTLYDMAKSLSKEMCLHDIRLLEKRGGKSGTWQYRSSAEPSPASIADADADADAD
ncbi:MAG: cyclic pyranopterin monophosphate synthase MoaC [Myxococcota bacterium]